MVNGIMRRSIFICVDITGDGNIGWREMDIMPIFSGVYDGFSRRIVAGTRVGKAINIVVVGTCYRLGGEMAVVVV